jgi:hypothetical protein
MTNSTIAAVHEPQQLMPLLDSYTAEPETVSESEQIPANSHKQETTSHTH